MKFLSVVLWPVATGAVAFASLGSCSTADQSVKNPATISIQSDSQDRSFLVWTPPNYNSKTASPVIISYHGGTKTAQDQRELDGLTDAASDTASIVVYPQGIDNRWQGVPDVTTNDVQFTSDILDYLKSNYNIDTSRIYATGKSDGGGFVNVLACDAGLSTRIAAFAPVSGAYYIDASPCHPESVKIPCSPGRKHIPFLAFHGGNDSVIDYNGGKRKQECLPSIPHFIQQWAIRDGLGSDNNTSPVADDTVLYKFGRDANEGLVEHIYDSVIGHDWPSTAPNHDNSLKGHHPASFNATPIILEFFRKYSLPSSE